MIACRARDRRRGCAKTAPTGPRRGWLGWAVLSLVLFGLSFGTASAQSIDTTLWCLSPGGRVLASVRSGNTIYIGGNFRSIGKASGGGVPFDLVCGQPHSTYPKVAGEVDAVLADGAGGWFIGGKFAAVGGQPRRNFAHILADGSVDPWSPDPDGEVKCIAGNRGRLYIGGAFSVVAGEPRSRIAALAPGTRQLLPWAPGLSGGTAVQTIAVDGSLVYVGGDFTSLGGQPRQYVAALDASSGLATDWDAQVDCDVSSIELGDSVVFLGGCFGHVGGVARPYLAAVQRETGQPARWDPQVVATYVNGPPVQALLRDGDRLFVAGYFVSIGGRTRPGLAVLDIQTALATEWDAQVRLGASVPNCIALAKSGNTLFLAGAFDSIGGLHRDWVGAVDATSGAVRPWDARPNDYVFALGADGSGIYLGGMFTSVYQPVMRHDLAAIDARTGAPTNWAPEPSDIVYSLATRNGVVYVGGSFGLIGGQTRYLIAAVDSATGSATAWNPGANAVVYAIAPVGDRVYVGGRFTRIGGQARNRIAALDATTGLATSWNPDADDDVCALLATDSLIYVGGWFWNISGQPRLSLAALDSASGAASPWNPGTDGGNVQSLAAGPAMILVGGYFHQLGGVARECFGAVDLSGVTTPLVANTNGQVMGIVVCDTTVVIGGFFGYVSGLRRWGMAALDLRSGDLYDWNLDTDEPFVWSLSGYGNEVYAGGVFRSVGTQPQSGFAGILLGNRPPSGTGSRVLRLLNFPNPTHELATCRFVLPASLPVRLEVFDLMGRRMISYQPSEAQTAGQHEVQVSTATWKAGVYLCRLEAGQAHATSKLVVVR